MKIPQIISPDGHINAIHPGKNEEKILRAQFLFPFVSDYICGAIREGKPFIFSGRSGNAQIGIKTDQLYPNKLPQEQRPEVAFFGRSNVGKSSLINTLLGRRGVARISKTPGKTRSANYFLINDRFFFVDMPGYGFARAPKPEIARWTKIFDQYVQDTTRNNGLIQLIDARHDPTSSDIENVRRLSAAGRPVCLVFNKSDKVKPSQFNRRIRDSISCMEVSKDAAVITFSSVSGDGRRELWRWIEEVLSL